MAKTTIRSVGRAVLGGRTHIAYEVVRDGHRVGTAYATLTGVYSYGAFTGSRARLLAYLNKVSK